MTIDVQALTMLEAVVLLVLNGVGTGLAWLAWRVTDVVVRLAVAEMARPDDGGGSDPVRLHNLRLIAENDRHAELKRLQCHCLIALAGAIWVLTPQPTNPDVIPSAIAIRAVLLAVTALLIEKTVHHLLTRWRFDRPGSRRSLRHLGPAIRLAWREARA